MALQHVVIPAGQVRHVKCEIPPTFDTSNPLVLFEPSESSPQLQQLDVSDSLIEICQAKVPFVRVPISNHTKHDVTLPCRTALGRIEPVSRIVQADELNLTKSSVAQEVNREESSETQLDKGGHVAQEWDPPVDVSHLSEDQKKTVKKMLQEESGICARRQ